MTGSGENDERARAVVAAALERPQDERPSYVADTCSEDPTLYATVMAILATHPSSADPSRPGAPRATPLPPDTLLAPHGTTVASSQHRILGVLGSGGFGITYLAEWLGARVAIKEFLPADFALRAADSSRVMARSAELRDVFVVGLERFEDEARTLLQLKDVPSIVKALSYFEANDTAYLVMDYASGKTLERTLRDGGPLPGSDLRRILILLLESLSLVHARGYLHRDIKPSNVLILEDGRPLLLDFGSARHALGEHSRTLTIMLSPGYAPFEQYQTTGSGPYTDLYSLGATAYRCLLQCSASDAEALLRRAQSPDRVAALESQRSDPLTPALEIGAGRYDTDLLHAIDAMLKIWPRERPQNAAEVLRLLGATLPAAAGETDDSPKSAPGWRRSVALVAVLAVIVLAGIGLFRAASHISLFSRTSETDAALLQLRSDRASIDGKQLESLLVRLDFYDARVNPSGKGVAHRYAREVIGDDLVIRDEATGLMWQARGSDTDQQTFPDTQIYVDRLNTDRFAGQADWRVPTLEEALSLLERETTSGKHLSPLFTGAPFIWTSDTAPATEGEERERGWVVYFHDGRAFVERHAFNASVRAVRTLRR